jgi:hypothetical protein
MARLNVLIYHKQKKRILTCMILDQQENEPCNNYTILYDFAEHAWCFERSCVVPIFISI